MQLIADERSGNETGRDCYRARCHRMAVAGVSNHAVLQHIERENLAGSCEPHAEHRAILARATSNSADVPQCRRMTGDEAQLLSLRKPGKHDVAVGVCSGLPAAIQHAGSDACGTQWTERLDAEDPQTIMRLR